MKLFYPGRFALPATLFLAAFFIPAAGLGMVQTASLMRFLPLGLIAAGIEELYFWSRSAAAEPKKERAEEGIRQAVRDGK